MRKELLHQGVRVTVLRGWPAARHRLQRRGRRRGSMAVRVLHREKREDSTVDQLRSLRTLIGTAVPHCHTATAVEA
jgi:hypothetical protein